MGCCVLPDPVSQNAGSATRVAFWWKSDSDLGLIGFRDGDETAVIYTAPGGSRS
jgi:hypothetical protein